MTDGSKIFSIWLWPDFALDEYSKSFHGILMNLHVLKWRHYREIGSISRTLHTWNDVRFGASGLQKGQFVFLTRLCEAGETTVVKLARAACVDQTTATKAVQKLEIAGFIQRRPDPNDRRSQILSPTAKAISLVEHIVDAENEDLDKGFQGFSPEETEQFLSYLIRVRENMLKTPEN